MNRLRKWSRGTRAYSRRRDTGSSAIRKSAAATSPEPVYSQRSSAASRGWPEGTAWAARPTPRPADPLHSLHTAVAHHGAPPPGSPSTPPARDLWLSHESRNQKRFLVRCPLAPPV